MKLASRITQIIGDGSDGWDLFRKARGMIAKGIPVTELTIGEHDIRTDPAILHAMHGSAAAGATGYASIPGIPALRAAVADRITAQTGVPTTAANILITAGGQSALFAAHHAACDEGDRALFIDPYYATYPGTIRAVGAVPVAIRAEAADAFQPRASAIAAQAPGARSLMINTPNNPTGVVYSRQTLLDIAQVCIDHDLWLISDEVYDTQVWEGTHISPRTLPGMADRTFVVGSLSKSHAMTGSRIGWVCGPAPAIGPMIDLATHTNYGIPGFIQEAGLFALQQGAAFEDTIAAPFRRRRAITLDLLARQNVVHAAPLAGAMYAMLDIRATGLTGEAFAEALLDAERIAVMPGESFGQAAAGHVRVAMTVPDDRYAEALGRLLSFAARLAASPAQATA
jgi:arginine:pyruvate transaminase